jgi:hypothetical protein
MFDNFRYKNNKYQPIKHGCVKELKLPVNPG